METEQIDRGKTAALHLLHQVCQLGAEAGGLGFVAMHDGVFKQGIQLLLACAGLPSSVRSRSGQPPTLIDPITAGRRLRGKTAAWA